MKGKLKLRDLICYFEPDELIQIGVKYEDEWDDCIDIKAGNSLLVAYYDWDISCMGAELNNDEDPIPVLRVMIEKPE